MTRWRALLFSVALGCAVLGHGPGCAAPTLPIPPPSVGALSAPDVDGFVTVSGSARPDAYVFVLNEETTSGVITHATPAGTYTARLQAMSGQTITVWQMVGSQTGELVDRIVP